MGREKRFDESRLFRCINSRRIILRGKHLDGCAVFERAQLLQGLGLLQWRGRPSDKTFKKPTAVCIDALVPQNRQAFHCIAEKRERGAREIERPSVQRRHHLHHIRVLHRRVGYSKRVGRSRHVQTRITRDSFRQLIDQRRINQWLVALDVDDVGRLWNSAHCLRDPVGARRVFHRGHHRLAAERDHHLADPLVIRRNENLVQTITLLAAVPNVLDQRFSRNPMKRLSRKTSRSPTRGKNSKNMAG